MGKKINILLLEGNEDDADSIVYYIKNHGLDCTVNIVNNRIDYINALSNSCIDIILAEYTLSMFDKDSGLEIAERLQPDTPYIFISEKSGEKLAEEIIKKKAFDYILKGSLHRLIPVITKALYNSKTLICNRQIEKKLEETHNHLLQVQKMEAIATLAGGISHDFNNILFSIIGYTELISQEKNQTDQTKKFIDGIFTATTRAQNLINQIFIFSRQKEFKKGYILIDTVIKETLKLLRASISSRIKFKTSINANNCFIFSDHTSIHQIVMNLCTNACHAMEDKGGILNISLFKTDLNKEDLKSEGNMSVGAYLKLEIKDTGTGIDSAVKNKIFEPYFTTKESGTGIGLSVVSGIIKKLKGKIDISSQHGKGTTVTVYLPEADSKDRIAKPYNQEKESLKGKGHILFVDDEIAIAEMQNILLQKLGYTVTYFTESRKALDFFIQNQEIIDIVISDFNMPELSGIELSKQIKKIRKDLPIILCSGFYDDAMEKQIKKNRIDCFAKKPFFCSDLSIAIRKLLDS